MPIYSQFNTKFLGQAALPILNNSRLNLEDSDASAAGLQFNAWTRTVPVQSAPS